MRDKPRRVWGLLLLMALVPGAPAGAAAAEPETAKVVSLTIDYGDDVQKRFTGLAWKEEATVFDLLQLAAKHPRGIKVAHQGTGATTLITAIDDLKNEGRGKNWLFEVNGKLGEKSCALVELKAGDAVLWRFATYK